MTNNKSNHHKLIIIGSGPAGLTAGIYAARAKLEPLIIQGDNPGGQLMATTTVENWPGEKGIMGPELMMRIQAHAKHIGCAFLADSAVKADISQRPFTITTKRGTQLTAHSLIVASGAVPKRLDCPGESDYWGKGITTCAVCDSALYQDKKVIIVGGGDTSMEFAQTLSKFTKEITIIQVIDRLTASEVMQERVLKKTNIKIVYDSIIKSIQGNGSWVTMVTIVNTKTHQISELPTDGLFLAIGQRPNTAFLHDQLELNSLGYLKTSANTQTSVKGIFAAGDVMDCRYRQAITSAGTGCMAALDAERYLESLR